MKVFDEEVPVLKIMGWSIVGLAALTGIWIVGSTLATGARVATAPGRVISKALETDNIIHNYEWFHDTNAAYLARRGQIQTHRRLTSAETDAKERSRLNMELAAMQQSCRELVTRYNANATKTNRSIFMGKEAPEALTLQTCE